MITNVNTKIDTVPEDEVVSSTVDEVADVEVAKVVANPITKRLNVICFNCGHRANECTSKRSRQPSDNGMAESLNYAPDVWEYDEGEQSHDTTFMLKSSRVNNETDL